MASTINPLTSPTLSSSFSEYDIVSTRSRSGSMASVQLLPSSSDDSDDEIVWDVSEGVTSSDEESQSVSESDFILLSHPVSAAQSATGLSTPAEPSTPLASQALEVQMAALSLAAKSSKTAAKKKAKKARKATAKADIGASPAKSKKKGKKNTPSASGSPPVSPAAGTAPKKAKGNMDKALVKHTGLGARPIVDDFSDKQSIISQAENDSLDSPTVYEEAASFISSFLSNPTAKNDSVYRLTLMQSIIIELGLATASLPSSLRAAKVFLKSRVFLNIREYLAVRDQGPEAVRRAMYPSKNALIKDIRKNPTPLKWVKQHGLQVLLVGWMQH